MVLDPVFELEIPARPEFVAVARLVVATAARSRRTLEEERVDDLTLALSEACTNAIEAHGGHAEDELVLVKVEEADDRFVVTIADRGPGFDPMEVPITPPVEDPERLRYERGLGIPIIRSLVDEVTFLSGAEGTTVSMVLFCPPAPGPELELDADELGPGA